MRFHTKRGIRLGLAVGIELFLGYVLVAPLGGMCKVLHSSAVSRSHKRFTASHAGELTPLAIQVQEGCMWAAFTRSGFLLSRLACRLLGFYMIMCSAWSLTKVFSICMHVLGIRLRLDSSSCLACTLHLHIPMFALLAVGVIGNLGYTSIFTVKNCP